METRVEMTTSNGNQLSRKNIKTACRKDVTYVDNKKEMSWEHEENSSPRRGNG